MKKIIILLCSLVFLSSCQVNNESLENDFFPIKGEKEMKGTLKISKLANLDYSSFEDQVAGFKMKYPGVEIIVNKYDNFMEYMTKMNVELMSGTADDIMDCTGTDYYGSIDNGYVVNFNDLIQKDKSFIKEDYYQNVFDAYTYKNGLYVFPVNFEYRMIGVNKDVSNESRAHFDEHDYIGYNDVLEIYKGDEMKNVHYVESSFSILNQIFRNLKKYIDMENKTCDFNNNEFIQLITECKQFIESDNKAWFAGNSHWDFVDPDNEEMLSSKYMFFEASSYNLQYLLPCDSDFVNFKPILGGTDKISVFSNSLFIMNRKSENKALAWEFIKFLTSEEGNKNYFPTVLSIPIKKELFREVFQKQAERQIETLEYYNIYPEGEPEEYINAALDKLSTFNEQPMEVYEFKNYDIFVEELMPFYKDQITAEQAAANLQNRMTLKLNE